MKASPPAFLDRVIRATVSIVVLSSLLLLADVIDSSGQLQPGEFLVVDYDANGGSGALFLPGPLDQEWDTLSSGQHFVDPVDVVIDELGRIFGTTNDVQESTSAATPARLMRLTIR